MEKRLIYAHIALFIVALIYGLNYIIAKDVMVGGYLHPFTFILLRVATASFLLWITDLVWIRDKVEKKDLGYLALCGLFGVAANQLLFFSGLKLASPIHASLIMTCSPVLVLVMAQIFLKERLTMRKILGILIAMTGAIWLITNGQEVAMGGRAAVLGDLLVLLNASAYAVYLVLVKRMLKKYHPVLVIKWVFTFGLIYVIPFGISQWHSARFGEFTANVWLSVAFVLFFTTYLVYLLIGFALKEVSPTIVSVYIYLQPIIASLTAVLLAKDHLSSVRVLCGLLIFLGIYLVSFRPRKRRKIGEQVPHKG
jgi:drug/metabolite transporter (DMT)-like permease